MKPYKIKKSNIDKRGLYASKDIKEGTKIIDYVGKIISKKESEKNSKLDNGKVVSILEGGYDLNALKESAEYHINALLEFNWKFYFFN